MSEDAPRYALPEWLVRGARSGQSERVASDGTDDLPEELQQLRDDLQRGLAADGWHITVRLAHRDGHADVIATHPLVPGEHGYQDAINELPGSSRRWLQHWREVQLVHAAPVRPTSYALLRGLRGAAGIPNGDSAPQTVRAVGYVLFEEGILTEDEARWLDEAVEPDPELDPRARRS